MGSLLFMNLFCRLAELKIKKTRWNLKGCYEFNVNFLLTIFTDTLTTRFGLGTYTPSMILANCYWVPEKFPALQIGVGQGDESNSVCELTLNNKPSPKSAINIIQIAREAYTYKNQNR